MSSTQKTKNKKAKKQKKKDVYTFPNNIRNRHWCFTDFNVDTLHKDWLSNICSAESKTNVRYMCYGDEIANETGKRHLQGFISFENAISGKSVKRNLLSNILHIEIARNVQASITYCKKEGNFVEYGTAPEQQGKRSDLQSIKEWIDNDKDFSDLYNEHFGTMIRYSKGIEKYFNLKGKKRDWITTVNVLWGESGTGKTRRVYEDTKAMGYSMTSNDIYLYPGGGWFDGYNGQKIVLFDDFYGDLKASLLLKVLDRYPLLLPVKGAHVNFAPEIIYITSNVHPKDWYPNIPDEVRTAIMRRISTITHMKHKPAGTKPTSTKSKIKTKNNRALTRLAIGSSSTQTARSDCNTNVSGGRTLWSYKGSSPPHSVTSVSDSSESDNTSVHINIAQLLDADI